MKYTIQTSSYNDRRYGKPWAAFVTTSLTKDFDFIDWDGRPGGAGEFSFEAEPGTMIARGQKDIRKGRGGVDNYYILMPDGTAENVANLSKRDSEIRKMSEEARWQYAAMDLLEKAVLTVRPGYVNGVWLRDGIKESNYPAAARFSKMLGIPDPLMARCAKDLGLVAEPAPETVAVSMDAFGL